MRLLLLYGPVAASSATDIIQNWCLDVNILDLGIGRLHGVRSTVGVMEPLSLEELGGFGIVVVLGGSNRRR